MPLQSCSSSGRTRSGFAVPVQLPPPGRNRCAVGVHSIAMASVPFRRGRFDTLPDLPHRPHPYFASEAIELDVPYPGVGRIATHVRKAGTGPPLLLVHGLMTSSYSWRYQLPLLGERYTLYAPDLPGNGRSSRPAAASFAPDHVVEWLGAVQDLLGIRGCRVIGNSMGGYLCMRWALRDPSAMSALVNLHSPGLPTARMYALGVALLIPGVRALMRALVRRAPERWAHRNVHYWDEDLKSREEAREYGNPLEDHAGRIVFGKHLAQTIGVGPMRAFHRELAARKARGEAFPIPLLLVYARRDPMVPPAVGRRLAALVPDAELIWMDEASHFAHVDAADRFAAIALGFLEGRGDHGAGGLGRTAP